MEAAAVDEDWQWLVVRQAAMDAAAVSEAAAGKAEMGAAGSNRAGSYGNSSRQCGSNG